MNVKIQIVKLFLCVCISLVVLEAWPWLRGYSMTPFGGLCLGLGWPGLGLGLGNAGFGLGLKEKVLALALDRGQGQEHSKT